MRQMAQNGMLLTCFSAEEPHGSNTGIPIVGQHLDAPMV